MAPEGPSDALARLPPEVLCVVLGLLDVASLAAGSAAGGVSLTDNAEPAWENVFQSYWPPTGMFRLKLAVAEHARGSARRRCALRACAARRDVDVVARRSDLS